MVGGGPFRDQVCRKLNGPEITDQSIIVTLTRNRVISTTTDKNISTRTATYHVVAVCLVLRGHNETTCKPLSDVKRGDIDRRTLI